MLKSIRYLVLFAALLGFGAAPALAQGKSSRPRDAQQSSAAKAERGPGGQARPDRSNRSQSKRGAKNDDSSANANRPASAKRRR